jgi:hypothetical protein
MLNPGFTGHAAERQIVNAQVLHGHYRKAPKHSKPVKLRVTETTGSQYVPSESTLAPF